MKKMHMKKMALAVALAGGSALAGYAADAKTTWADKCVKCHGADGKGDTKMGKKLEIKDYTDAKVQAGIHGRSRHQGPQGWDQGQRRRHPDETGRGAVR